MSIRTHIIYFVKDILRIASLIWETDKRLAVLNIALQIVQSLLPIISLYFIKELIEAVVAGADNLGLVIRPLIIFSIIQVCISALGQYSIYITTIYHQKLTDYLSGKVLQQAINVEYQYYQNPDYHDTLHLAQQQSMHKASLLLNNFNSVILNTASLIFLVSFFLTLQSFFAVLFIALSLPLAIIKWHYGHSIVRQERKLVPLEREANYIHNILTNANNAKEVRVLNFGNAFIERFRHIRSIIFNKKRLLYVKQTRYSAIAEIAEIIGMSIVFVLLAKSAMEKSITIGVFVIYIQGFQRLQSTSKNFLQSIIQILQQKIFLKDLFTFLDIKPGSISTENAAFPVSENGLSINNVSFTYPLSGKIVLRNVSMHCKPGTIIAIVGENGSGKSTLVNLLSRLYENHTGEIIIGDEQIKNISINDFREKTVFLFQDFEKYFMSVKKNITLGTDSTSKKETDILQSGKLSGAEDFISRLPQGYDTLLGKLFRGGEQLSGGQWQKLALSRMFYKDAQLVVLDEPTSALDAISEAELFNNIKETLGNKMVVLISHRLYNLKFADTIYVMHEGAIVEQGNFETLINSDGFFRKLYNAQKL